MQRGQRSTLNGFDRKAYFFTIIIFPIVLTMITASNSINGTSLTTSVVRSSKMLTPLLVLYSQNCQWVNCCCCCSQLVQEDAKKKCVAVWPKGLLFNKTLLSNKNNIYNAIFTALEHTYGYTIWLFNGQLFNIEFKTKHMMYIGEDIHFYNALNMVATNSLFQQLVLNWSRFPPMKGLNSVSPNLCPVEKAEC